MKEKNTINFWFLLFLLFFFYSLGYNAKREVKEDIPFCSETENYQKGDIVDMCIIERD